VSVAKMMCRANIRKPCREGLLIIGGIITIVRMKTGMLEAVSLFITNFDISKY
jgi:hypothetical protein